jgi:hypothetical protein
MAADTEAIRVSCQFCDAEVCVCPGEIGALLKKEEKWVDNCAAV